MARGTGLAAVARRRTSPIALAAVLGGGADGYRSEVRARDPKALAGALERAGIAGVIQTDGSLLVKATTEQVGEVAAAERAVLTGLQPRARSLEAAFFELTADQA